MTGIDLPGTECKIGISIVWRCFTRIEVQKVNLLQVELPPQYLYCRGWPEPPKKWPKELRSAFRGVDTRFKEVEEVELETSVNGRANGRDCLKNQLQVKVSGVDVLKM